MRERRGCGAGAHSNLLSNSASPDDIEYFLISDRRAAEIDDAAEAAASEKSTDGGLWDTLFNHADQVWKCDRCGRLYVFGDPDSNVATAVYALESPE